VLYGAVNRDKVGNFGRFDDQRLFGNGQSAHKKSIYSRYFSLTSQHKACSFSLCNPMNYTFSFRRVSLTKCWNFTAKIVDFGAWRRQFDQFAVVIARPRLGTRWIITSPVGARSFWSAGGKLSRGPAWGLSPSRRMIRTNTTIVATNVYLTGRCARHKL